MVFTEQNQNFRNQSHETLMSTDQRKCQQLMKGGVKCDS